LPRRLSPDQFFFYFLFFKLKNSFVFRRNNYRPGEVFFLNCVYLKPFRPSLIIIENKKERAETNDFHLWNGQKKVAIEMTAFQSIG